MEQAERDLASARLQLEGGFWEWACFASHQAAGKAIKAVYQKLGGEGWGHGLVDLLEGLRERLAVAAEVEDCARLLDRYYIPRGTRAPGPRVARDPTTRKRRRSVRSLVQKRSYGSATVFWLDREEAERRLRHAAGRLVAERPEVVAVYLFGSLATGRAVPGSDADVLVVLERSDERWVDRSVHYAGYFEGVGMAVELFCYTEGEVARVPLAQGALAGGKLLAGRRPGREEDVTPPSGPGRAGTGPA